MRRQIRPSFFVALLSVLILIACSGSDKIASSDTDELPDDIDGQTPHDADPDDQTEQPPVVAFVGNASTTGSRGSIWLASTRSDPRPLMSGGEDSRYPVWSRDGSEVAFVSTRDDAGGSSEKVFVCGADGSGVRSVSDWLTGARLTDWGPDGSGLLVLRNLRRLLLLNPEDGVVTELTAPTDAFEVDAKWTRTNDRILLVRQSARTADGELSNPDSNGIVLLDPLTGVSEKIASGSESTQAVSLSPTRDEFVYDVRVGDNREIMLGKIDGGAVPLASDPALDAQPNFSPDGEWVVFLSSRGSPGGAGLDIYKVRRDGTELTRLTDSQGSYLQPAWSPDGMIAFMSDLSGIWSIHVMEPTGGFPANLTAGAVQIRKFMSFGVAWRPGVE